jgi:hypothetical protein
VTIRVISSTVNVNYLSIIQLNCTIPVADIPSILSIWMHLYISNIFFCAKLPGNNMITSTVTRLTIYINPHSCYIPLDIWFKVNLSCTTANRKIFLLTKFHFLSLNYEFNIRHILLHILYNWSSLNYKNIFFYNNKPIAIVLFY